MWDYNTVWPFHTLQCPGPLLPSFWTPLSLALTQAHNEATHPHHRIFAARTNILGFSQVRTAVTLQHAKGYFLNNNSSSHWCLSLGPVRFLNTGLLKFYVFSIAAAVTGFDWFGLVFLELFDYSANCSYFWRQKFGWALLIFASHLAKAYQMFAEWLKRWLISVTTPKERMLFSRGQHSKPQPPKASQVLSAGSFIFVWPGAAWTAALESGICCPSKRRHNRTWDPNSTI